MIEISDNIEKHSSYVLTWVFLWDIILSNLIPDLLNFCDKYKFLRVRESVQLNDGVVKKMTDDGGLNIYF